MRLTIHADGTAPGRIRDDVGADLGIRNGTEGEARGGNEESGSVASGRDIRGQEDDIADHGQGAAKDDAQLTLIVFGAEPRDYEGEETTNDVGGDGEELLHDSGLLGVDGCHDSRGKEGQALDGNVVEQEDKRGGQSNGAEKAEPQLLLVDTVEHGSLSDTLRLDAGNGEIAFRLRKPSGASRAVGEREESVSRRMLAAENSLGARRYRRVYIRDDRKNTSDYPLDRKNHPPGMQTAKAVQGQDCRRQETAEGSGHRSHDDIER